MKTDRSTVSILMAEDDIEDQMLVREAVNASDLDCNLTVVNDGEELVEYLNQSGKPNSKPLPDIILMDLNMPRKNGHEALAEIKSAPKLRRIPIIVLTTSNAESDIESTYDMGISSYICKPVSFSKLIELVNTLGNYWFNLVELPSNI
jgi:CheY-like chemotaxis protein